MKIFELRVETQNKHRNMSTYDVPKKRPGWDFVHNLAGFLATLVALHFTPVSDSVGRWLIVSD